MAKQKIIVISGTMIVTAVIAVLLVARLTQNGKLVSQSNGSYLPVNPKTAIPEIADDLVDSDKFSFVMYQEMQNTGKLFYIGWEGNNTAFVLKRYDIPSKQLTNLTNSDSSIHKIVYPGGNRVYLSKYASKNKLYDLYSYDLTNQQLTNITNSENYSEIKSREVYLPEGSEWYDFWTGEKLKGGQKFSKSSPIDITPLFVKSGSILL